MTLEQRRDFFLSVIFEQMMAVCDVATREYATEDNIFANFERLSEDLAITREQVLWVYLRKHLDGIVSWINGFTSQREPVEGRIKDAMVYLGLLWCMEADRKAEEHNRPQPRRDALFVILTNNGMDSSEAGHLSDLIDRELS